MNNNMREIIGKIKVTILHMQLLLFSFSIEDYSDSSIIGAYLSILMFLAKLNNGKITSTGIQGFIKLDLPFSLEKRINFICILTSLG